ncbi:Vitamin B12 transporter BtuB [Alphaproteobacteria bacterium SO-S41]|nr:Vitamin B12 transporter BtuB [Alphaproteobacteria bacterium SO-S41]
MPKNLISARRLFWGSCAMAAALAMPAYAQEEAAAAAADAATDAGSEEVVVTARRREERLIDVPVAASALGTKAVEKYNSTDLATVAREVPGVTLSRTGGGGNGGALSIRGVGNLATDYGNEQPVAINLDGVQITRGRIATVGLFDVQQVEILKGPQALFFGKNSPAGVVSVISQGPGKEYGGYLKGSYEFETSTPQIEGAVDIPLSDVLALRIAGRWSEMYDGYITNAAKPLANPFDYNPATGTRSFINPGADHSEGPNTRTVVGRVTLAYQPSEDLSITLKLFGSREKDNGGYGYSEVVQCGIPPSPSVVLGPPVGDPYGDCIANNRISNGAAPAEITRAFKYGPADGKAFNETTNAVASLTINYDVGDISLTSVSGLYYSKNDAFDNYEGTVYGQAIDAQREENRQYTQEFRAVSNYEGPFNFTVGAYYQRDNRAWRNTDKILPFTAANNYLTPAQALLAVDPTRNVADYIGISNTAIFTAKNYATVYSAFAQGRYKITDALELSAGARWTKEEKETDIGAEMNEYAPFAAPGYRYKPSLESSNVSPEVTLSWKPADDITAYVAYKAGYLSGGIQNPGNVVNYHATCLVKAPTDVIGCENDLLSYDNQKVDGFEAGVKGYFFDGRLTADLTLYSYDYKNLQVTSFDATTLSFLIQNAGGSRSQGFEFSAQYKVSEEFRLRFGTAYTDLKYTDYSSGPCFSGQPKNAYTALDNRQAYLCYENRVRLPGETAAIPGEQYLSGTRYGGAPFQAVVGGTYSHEFESGLNLEMTLDYYYYSRAPRRITYSLGGEAHSLINGSIRLSSADADWDVALIGTNLTDDTWFPVPVTEKPYGAFIGGTSGDLASVLQPPRQFTLQITKRF